jgi:hypothetical protein
VVPEVRSCRNYLTRGGSLASHQCEAFTAPAFRDAAPRPDFCSILRAANIEAILRYEAHLDHQLYRATKQLKRLQRQRRGENVPHL